MTTAGFYEVCGGEAEILPDGSIVFHHLKIRPSAPKKKPGGCTLRDIWKENAPFPFEHLKAELLRHQYTNEDDIWVYYPTRGNHPTCSVHVRALYETLLMLNCIDAISFPEVKEIFNNTFGTKINNSKVLENKNKCIAETRYFTKLFESAFANAAANAGIESIQR